MKPGRSQIHHLVDVESILSRVHVDRFLLARQQIEQEGAEPMGLEEFGDLTIGVLNRLLPLPCAKMTSPVARSGTRTAAIWPSSTGMTIDSPAATPRIWSS